MFSDVINRFQYIKRPGYLFYTNPTFWRLNKEVEVGEVCNILARKSNVINNLAEYPDRKR
jgi:hypothetical protein